MFEAIAMTGGAETDPLRIGDSLALSGIVGRWIETKADAYEESS